MLTWRIEIVIEDVWKTRIFRKRINSCKYICIYIYTSIRRFLIIIDQFHKSQNAPVPYPKMFHSEQKCSHFCSEWCIVGYGSGALWDLWILSLHAGTLVQSLICSRGRAQLITWYQICLRPLVSTNWWLQIYQDNGGNANNECPENKRCLIHPMKNYGSRSTFKEEFPWEKMFSSYSF